MMLVRLAVDSDVEAYIGLARLAVAESVRGRVGFKAAKVRETFDAYLTAATPTIFVVEQDRELIGFLNATINGYPFADGLFTAQEVLFVRPDKRGTRAAVLLVQAFVSWSDQLGALESTGGNDNGLLSEQTAKLLGRFGFERVGYFLRRVPGSEGGNEQKEQR